MAASSGLRSQPHSFSAFLAKHSTESLLSPQQLLTFRTNNQASSFGSPYPTAGLVQTTVVSGACMNALEKPR